MNSYKTVAIIYGELGKCEEKRNAYKMLLRFSRGEQLEDNIQNITHYLKSTETLLERILRWLGITDAY